MPEKPPVVDYKMTRRERAVVLAVCGMAFLAALGLWIFVHV